MDNRKETVILFRGQIESLLSLSSLKDVKTILRAIVLYGMDNETPEIPEHLTFGWLWFKNTIDSHREQYAAKCGRNRNSANKRWGNGDDIPMDADECERMRTDANACERMRTHKNHAYNDNDKDKDYLNRERKNAYAYASDAEKIANLYPKSRIGNWQNVVLSIISAIQREFDRGNAIEEAIEKITQATQKYAQDVKEDKNSCYLYQGVNFFNEGIYNNDPATWKKTNNKGSKNDSSYEYTSKLG